MPKLKVPSLQQLARNWRPDPQKVKWQLVELVNNPPNFNYNALFGATRDLLVFKQPYADVVRGIQKIRREDLRANFLEVLPLLSEHFSNVDPEFVQSVDRRHYWVSKKLPVPFEPPLVYGLGGRLCFPWLSFWRAKPLQSEKLSLFVTMVDDLLLDDPDFEGATFDILDFSVRDADKGRELNVIKSAEIPRLPPAQKNEMLEIFAQGFALAQAELAGQPETESDRKSEGEQLDPNQPGFFD